MLGLARGISIPARHSIGCGRFLETIAGMSWDMPRLTSLDKKTANPNVAEWVKEVMRSNSDLAEFSKHVLYEMTMLVGIPRKFAEAVDDVTRNALLESFAIHARQLVDFFYDHAHSREITARDYFDDPLEQWQKIRGKEDPQLKNMVARVSEEIAHLTLERLKAGKTWDFAGIVQALKSRIEAFLAGVGDAKINQVDRSRYLQMVHEHDGWERSVSSAPTSSGWLTGKTCP